MRNAILRCNEVFFSIKKKFYSCQKKIFGFKLTFRPVPPSADHAFTSVLTALLITASASQTGGKTQQEVVRAALFHYRNCFGIKLPTKWAPDQVNEGHSL